MWKNPNKPAFGVLDGLKVVHTSTNMAGPMAATLLADQGADVLWMENPFVPDSSRFSTVLCLENERRNSRNIAVDIPSEEGKKIFRKVLEDADIFIEAWKAGTLDKWGMSDEVLWSWNPKLIIVHITGYGQTGLPEYTSRGGYDGIGQAASGFMKRNMGTTTPFTCDATTAVYAAYGALAALYRVQKTGKGESIDVSQVEAMMRHQVYLSDYATDGRVYGDERKFNSGIAGWGPFPAADGKEVYVVGMGGNTMKKGADWLGLPYGSEMNPVGNSIIFHGTEAGEIWHKMVGDYVASVPAAEAERELLAHSIPASLIVDYPDLLANEHWQMRNSFAQWESFHGRTITGTNAMPVMKNNPGQVWRGAPGLGMDNEEVLAELGYTEEEIKALYENNIINKRAIEDFIQ